MDIACKILIPNSLKATQDGSTLLELLLHHFPLYVPEKYGREEPLRKRFSVKDLRAVLDDWGYFCFAAERKNPSLWFNVWFAVEGVPDPGHTSVHVRLRGEDVTVMLAVQRFLAATSITFGADLAVAHILTGAEFAERIDSLSREPGSNPGYLLQRAEKVGTAEVLDGMTVTQFKPNIVKCGLPDLCWLTVFGPPYVDLFGRDRILSAPADEVSELSNGSLVMRLTDTFLDDQAGWEAFRKVRSACKQHLNCDAFFVPGSSTGRYSAPKFRFPLEMYRAHSIL